MDSVEYVDETEANFEGRKKLNLEPKTLMSIF